MLQSTQITLSILLASAKSAIATEDPEAPSLTQWYKNLWGHFLMAKITDGISQLCIRTPPSKFIAIWFSIMEYLQEAA